MYLLRIVTQFVESYAKQFFFDKIDFLILEVIQLEELKFNSNEKQNILKKMVPKYSHGVPD